MKKSPVTQEDIAAKLKVSRVTVSKALRDHPDISPAMKEKVKKAAETMGYSPNLIASQLSLRKTSTLGVVIPDLENSFFAYLADSIIDTASDRDYRTILTVSREKADIEEQNIRNLLGMRVDGLLVCVSQQTRKPDIFRYAGKVGIPLVFFDRAVRNLGCSSIVFNDRKGTKDALAEILAAGYDKIAHFAGYTTVSIGRDRLASFRSYLKDHGIPIKKEWIIEGGYEVADGYNAFMRLLASGNLPQLILTVNDRVALGAMRAAGKAGLDIPGDVGIMAYGFNETAEMFNPHLAVINQDPRKMGIVAANRIIDEITGKAKAGTRILIDESFIFNSSIK